MKKILFVASEAVPFIKTGGLADVVGSLPKCFDKHLGKEPTTSARPPVLINGTASEATNKIFFIEITS